MLQQALPHSSARKGVEGTGSFEQSDGRAFQLPFRHGLFWRYQRLLAPLVESGIAFGELDKMLLQWESGRMRRGEGEVRRRR